jgi:tetratricopeptide (TPR) repeat protein
MSDQDNLNDGSLVPTGGTDLAPVAAVNTLVARGMADLARIQLRPETENRQLQSSRATSLVKHEGLQALLDEGKEAGYVTYRQVSDYLNVRVFRIEPDGPVKVLPDDRLNQEKLAQLLKVLDEHAIELIDETEAPELGGEDALFYYRRGNVWFEKGEYNKAIIDYDQVLSGYEDVPCVDPEFAPACQALIFFHRGKAWLEEKQYDQAIKDFGEVMRLDPDYSPALLERAQAWSAKKEYDRAIQDCKEAIRLDPENAEAHERLASLVATFSEQG